MWDSQHIVQSCKSTTRSLSSLLQIFSFTTVCSGLHQRLFVYRIKHPPLLFPLILMSLSAQTTVKSGVSTQESSMLSVSQLSFVTMDGMDHLCITLLPQSLAFSLAPALHPRYDFHSSPGILLLLFCSPTIIAVQEGYAYRIQLRTKKLIVNR